MSTACPAPVRFLILSLVALPLLFSAKRAVADNGYYRIEVLIFNHLEVSDAPLQMDEIRSFSNFMPLDEYQTPPAPSHLEVMSSDMQDTWRRLRLSATYRPLLFAAWEQSRIDYHPPVRLHDEELIAEQLEFKFPVAFIDLQSMDMFENYLAPYYRLDGSVQLVRSRFLHLNIDLEYRQDLLPRSPAQQTIQIQPLPSVADADFADIDVVELPDQAANIEQLDEVVDPSPGPALVFALKQSRQIRTGQMQYFDTPYLGVLIRVTATSGQ